MNDHDDLLEDAVWVGNAPHDSTFALNHAKTLEGLAPGTLERRVVVLDLDREQLEKLPQTAPAELSSATILVVAEPTAERMLKFTESGFFACIPPQAQSETRDAFLRLAIEHARRRATAPARPPPRAYATLRHADFELQTLEEAESIAEHLAACCPEPSRRVGGLLELLVNAIEHGNLALSGEEKQRLLMRGTWQAEIERRLADPTLGARRAHVTFDRASNGDVTISIRDEGSGFDYRSYAAGADDPSLRHGRGIALARALSFDALEWLGSGNCVVGLIRR